MKFIQDIAACERDLTEYEMSELHNLVESPYFTA